MDRMPETITAPMANGLIPAADRLTRWTASAWAKVPRRAQRRIYRRLVEASLDRAERDRRAWAALTERRSLEEAGLL